MADVPYGPHERNVLDFYQAKSDKPTPLALYIHGGGFRGGSKRSVNQVVLRDLLAAGISVAAIEYRLVPEHPLPIAHHDSLRALQFIRSKATPWKIDRLPQKTRDPPGSPASARATMRFAPSRSV